MISEYLRKDIEENAKRGFLSVKAFENTEYLKIFSNLVDKSKLIRISMFIDKSSQRKLIKDLNHLNFKTEIVFHNGSYYLRFLNHIRKRNRKFLFNPEMLVK